MVQPHLESLLRTLLSSEKHPDVLEDKRRILVNLISRLPLDNLEDRATQIIVGLCRQGGAGCNRVAKALMQRLPPTAVVIKLISDDFLKAHSSRVSHMIDFYSLWCFKWWVLPSLLSSWLVFYVPTTFFHSLFLDYLFNFYVLKLSNYEKRSIQSKLISFWYSRQFIERSSF